MNFASSEVCMIFELIFRGIFDDEFLWRTANSSSLLVKDTDADDNDDDNGDDDDNNDVERRRVVKLKLPDDDDVVDEEGAEAAAVAAVNCSVSYRCKNSRVVIRVSQKSRTMAFNI